MLNSTPEYVSAHRQELAAKPPKAGPELVARYREERRLRRRRFAASVLRALPFVRPEAGGEVASVDVEPVM